MDEALRDLERRWTAGDAQALQPLVRAYGQAGRELPFVVIQAFPRWQGLLQFASRWCTRPLGPDDGISPDVIARREAKLGFRLPAALREWYRLVGASLRVVQDTPVRLEDLALEGGSLAVFVEIQACFFWAVREAHLMVDDPVVHAAHDLMHLQPLDGSLSELLTAKTIWEAAMNAGVGGGHCTVGELAAGVRGDAFEYADADVERELRSRYPRLALMKTGWSSTSELHGSEDTVIELDGNGFGNVMARTPEAWSAVRALPGLRFVNAT